MLRRKKGIARAAIADTFWPLTMTLPELTRSITGINLSSVLLPAPECPVTNSNSASATKNETPLSAA